MQSVFCPDLLSHAFAARACGMQLVIVAFILLIMERTSCFVVRMCDSSFLPEQLEVVRSRKRAVVHNGARAVQQLSDFDVGKRSDAHACELDWFVDVR